ncbi:DUF2332 domain-containing protein [Paenibacillus sp. 481]|uniref:DUF2332 domain-containing protein n=1 Tax=Paenibacillus sp. 481 TaxID=2835869 RepID=UPI001E5B2C31|nr:DUF2332 domain-containing protein [Paenibacillus sp. 481]UHA72230.1 DUF2332 domain-containing protein [Paenibacillus sp. 481]
MNRQQLSHQFRTFAENCHDSSPLYEHLAMNIAEHDELLELASHAQQSQPVANLLFAAVHYLLLQGTPHDLAQYYASLVDEPHEAEHSFEHFECFCRHYREEIVALLNHKIVQTNEVRRCSYLYPSFCYMYEQGVKPLALIEIGTSAGLQLMWDKYSYSYGSSDKYGNSASKVHIQAEIRGDRSPFLLATSPPVTARYGIDLHPNDLSNPEHALWLKALIWPEHNARVELLEQAASYLDTESVQLIAGDGVQLLPQIASRIPTTSTICIFHTHVANQLPAAAKHALVEQVKALGQTRDVFHLHNNMWSADLQLDYWIDGTAYSHTVAETDGHGRWFRWKM